MVKPLSIFVPVLSLCLLLVLLLPLLTKPEPGKIFQVSVTTRSTATIEAPAVVEATPTAEIFDAPVPQSGLVSTGTETLTYPGLGEFASSLLNGNTDEVVGIYVNSVLALPVLQQPAGHSDFVAAEPNMLTQFSMPKTYDTIGILAHNYLSGSRFAQLSQGMEVVVVYGGGKLKRFTITHAESYQALSPNSPFSDFINLDDPTRRVMTSADLFKRMYVTSGRLIFQTCIEANGEPSWGRLFLIAEPADTIQLSIPALQTVNDLN